ncbi:MAG: hypothetical protein QM754_07575 [Tepidisphaeraceae bacterium]
MLHRTGPAFGPFLTRSITPPVPAGEHGYVMPQAIDHSMLRKTLPPWARWTAIVFLTLVAVGGAFAWFFLKAYGTALEGMNH